MIWNASNDTASTNVAQELLKIRHIYTNDKLMKKAFCIDMVLTYDIDAQHQTQQVAKSCKAPSTRLANHRVGKRVASLIL